MSDADYGFTGQRVIVTGGTRGIGECVASAFASCGASVVSVGRSEPSLGARSDERIHTVQASLEDPRECARVVREADELMGGVDVLVNNAGMGSTDERPIWKADSAVWHASFAVNLHAPFELTRLVAPQMVSRGSGRIVMVSSTAGQVGGPAAAAYCASKHGLLGLMRSVALDVASFGVTCNAVCPGWVRTQMSDALAEREAARGETSVDEIWRRRAAATPGKRIVTAAEVAAAVLFLSSAAAAGINGEAITVALGSAW